jgi:predicted Co/Zn/Cd cation transporter (cation efflux family)
VNRAIDSEPIGLDIKSWWMSACISATLLLAFSYAWLLEWNGQGHLTPYIDPGVLAILTLVLIPIPIRTVIGAVKKVLLITPPDLERELRDLMQRLTADYGSAKRSHYATRVGSGLVVKVHFVLPEAMEYAGVRQFDQIRDRIARAIGESGPDRWLTVAFTREPRWLSHRIAGAVSSAPLARDARGVGMVPSRQTLSSPPCQNCGHAIRRNGVGAWMR